MTEQEPIQGRIKRNLDMLSNLSTKNNFLKMALYLVIFFLLYVSTPMLSESVLIWKTLVKIIYSILIFLLGAEIIHIVSTIIPRRINSHRTSVITRQLLTLLWGLVIVSSLFTLLSIEPTIASVILGIVGFGLTFSLQQPILSFIGWVYIVWRDPFEIGDRIKVGEDIKGDVLHFDYFSTHLLEVGGEYTSTQTPSGRTVTFPNAMLLQKPVFNYTKTGNFIWDEISINVAYGSDLEFIDDTIQKALEDDFAFEELEKSVKKMAKMYNKSFIHDVEIDYKPSVIFLPNSFGWIEVKTSYMTNIKTMSLKKKELTKVIMGELKKHPDKIKFPGNVHNPETLPETSLNE